jgi:membrane protein implicated in regulation of membrane protease activity
MASTTRNAKKGVSLAKGPVALLGAVMLAYGIIAFLLGGTSFSSSPPSGDVTGDTFLSIEGNGWTNVLWAAGGALLLFGSPFHWGAKTIALIVGLALGAASVISMFDGWDAGDVLGIFATNSWTTLALGAASAYLLLTALLPRVGKKDRDDRRDDDRLERREREVVRERPVREREVVRERPVHEHREHREVVAERPVRDHDVRHHDGRDERLHDGDLRNSEVVAPASDPDHTEAVAERDRIDEPGIGREREGRFDRTTARDDLADVDAERTRNPRRRT